MKLEQVSVTTFQYCQLRPDSPVITAVSGGPDSLCLLDVLSRLGLQVIVAHFNHYLRPDSTRDAQSVQNTAQRMNLPFLLGGEDVKAYANQMRLSIEEAARILRYRFLFSQARAQGAQAVAAGHNADDQVETLLMRLLRGSGLSGLKGMSYRTMLTDFDSEIPLVRPLLPFFRAEIAQYNQARGLEPLQDESNFDPAFQRNRVRHELIPLLETYNPQVRQAIWRTASLLEGDSAVIEGVVREAWAACLVQSSPRHIALRLAALQQMRPGLLRAVLRYAAAQILPTLRDVDYAAVERAAGFAARPIPGQIDLVQGVVVFYETALDGEPQLVIALGEAPPDSLAWPQLEPHEEQAVPEAGEVVFSSGWRLICDRVDAPTAGWQFGGDTRWEAWVDAKSLPGPLNLRRPRSGDRFQPLGMAGRSMKLSDFWINEKLPRRARAGWPILTAGDEIVWVPGFRLSHQHRVQPSTQRALRLRLVKPVPA
jgi:tRNA(Ile)-lysidine synthase